MNLPELQQFLNAPRRVAILTHTRPDGDAIGSSLGLWHFLKACGHQPTVLIPTPMPALFNFLPDSNTIICYEDMPKQAMEQLQSAEILFILDLNDYKRLEGLCEPASQHPAPKVLIDHHLYPSIEADFAHCNVHISSTAELIYQFIGLLGKHDALNADIATCIYTGIATDTGRFKFNTQAETLATVSHLLRCGVDMAYLNRQIFDQNSEKQLRLLGFALSERLTLLPQYNAAYIALDNKDLARFGFEAGDTEGIVNYPLSIAAIQIAALITEREGKVRLSLRSQGNFSVNDLSRRYFNGGGHQNAAGGSSNLSLAETVALFEQALREMLGETA
jgi:phosphoesterase RecJ-like protein